MAVESVRLKLIAILASVFALLILFAGGTRATEATIRLGLPLECTPGKDCFVQRYVNRDPGPGAKDHTCGPLTNDGHNGTDIRLVDLAALRAAVIAAAAGRVRAARDGMADVSVREAGQEVSKGRECGNGVLLEHGGGWQTQYCHMRKGSIAVARGKMVKAGEHLGLVGLSGLTEFPHLHISVRHHGQVVDPFVGESDESGCGVVARPLWTEAAARALAYRSSGLLAASFTDTVPKLAEIKEGRHRNSRLRAYGEVLVFWSYIFGLRQGDVIEMLLIGPDGQVVVEKRGEPAPKNKLTWLRYLGKRSKSKGWRPGIYRGAYRLLRGSEVVIEAVRNVQIYETGAD